MERLMFDGRGWWNRLMEIDVMLMECCGLLGFQLVSHMVLVLRLKPSLLFDSWAGTNFRGFGQTSPNLNPLRVYLTYLSWHIEDYQTKTQQQQKTSFHIEIRWELELSWATFIYFSRVEQHWFYFCRFENISWYLHVVFEMICYIILFFILFLYYIFGPPFFGVWSCLSKH
jgi:hypothetical protein